LHSKIDFGLAVIFAHVGHFVFDSCTLGGPGVVGSDCIIYHDSFGRSDFAKRISESITKDKPKRMGAAHGGKFHRNSFVDVGLH